jgi:hypothetical protein
MSLAPFQIDTVWCLLLYDRGLANKYVYVTVSINIEPIRGQCIGDQQVCQLVAISITNGQLVAIDPCIENVVNDGV